ncbi:MAG: hypothetical protein MUC92_09420 [Fimbriimonadaceae bacterium]|jgi:uncharacterized lipoprotein YajG|nr:hypothetical protein [Fimbriimonadaceae bacterium]
MLNKKVLLSSLFSLAALFVLAGCDGPTTPPPPTDDATRGKDMGDIRKAQIEAEKARNAADAQAGN